jgi:hypothetical protein
MNSGKGIGGDHTPGPKRFHDVLRLYSGLALLGRSLKKGNSRFQCKSDHYETWSVP